MDPSAGVPWLVQRAYLLWPVGLGLAVVAAVVVARARGRSKKVAGLVGMALWAVSTTVLGQVALVTDDVDRYGVPQRPWLDFGMLSPLHRDKVSLLVAAALADPTGSHGPERRGALLALLDRSSSCDPRVVDWLFGFGAWRRGATWAERCQLPDAAGRAAWMKGNLEAASDTFQRSPPQTEAGWELAVASHVLVGRWDQARAALGSLAQAVDPASAPPWRAEGLACLRHGIGALEGDAAAQAALQRGVDADDPMVRSACGLLHVATMPEARRADALSKARHAPPLDWLRHLWLAALTDASADAGKAPFVAPLVHRAPFLAPPSGWIYTVATWDRALARDADSPAQRDHRVALATHRASIAAVLGDLSGAAAWLRFSPRDDTPVAIRENWRTVAVAVAVARGELDRAKALLGEDEPPVRAVYEAARNVPTSLGTGTRSPWDERRLAVARAAARGDGRPLLNLLETAPPAIEPWMTWVTPRVVDGRDAIARHLRYGPVWDPAAGSILIDTDLQQLAMIGRVAQDVDAHELRDRTFAVQKQFAEALQEDRRRGIVLAILEAL